MGGECKGSMAEADKRKQNRNKLQMENAVALRQSPVDFGSQSSRASSANCSPSPSCHVNVAWGLIAQVVETAGPGNGLRVRNGKLFQNRKTLFAYKGN